MQKKCFGLRHKNKSIWKAFGWEEDNQAIKFEITFFNWFDLQQPLRPLAKP